MDSFIRLLAWNVYIGNPPEKVLRALEQLLIAHRPHVVVLMEASRLYGELGGLGYRVVQLKPRARKPGNQSATGNIAIMVRNDVRILRRFALYMTVFWRGPVHGWPQDPRVYRWLRIEWMSRVWKIGGAHHPFGAEARAESVRKLVNWLRSTRKGRPTALAIDANMSLHVFRRIVATPGGALASGDGIDLIAYKNAVIVAESNLGANGSDHPAMLYTLRAA